MVGLVGGGGGCGGGGWDGGGCGCGDGGRGVCRVIFVSNPTWVMLCWVLVELGI